MYSVSSLSCLQAKSMLNAVNALPQLEQAVKLIARVPQTAKWATDLHKIASKLSSLLWCICEKTPIASETARRSDTHATWFDTVTHLLKASLDVTQPVLMGTGRHVLLCMVHQQPLAFIAAQIVHVYI